MGSEAVRKLSKELQVRKQLDYDIDGEDGDILNCKISDEPSPPSTAFTTGEAAAVEDSFATVWVQASHLVNPGFAPGLFATIEPERLRACCSHQKLGALDFELEDGHEEAASQRSCQPRPRTWLVKRHHRIGAGRPRAPSKIGPTPVTSKNKARFRPKQDRRSRLVRLGYCATEAHSWARGGASASAAAMTSLLWNAQTGEARAVAAAPARQQCVV
ncbi:hypothetical protein HPB47_023638 [Ixodes persulcatus]|uniref:Uncharacterized protein n=1 Tax=Ixodes persulcatus TaxID=34615 RepID=A0AC60Q6Y5_IXOPE|nr:hypothetical protein HPB47_023638 [Ixodes persulcatus]